MKLNRNIILVSIFVLINISSLVYSQNKKVELILQKHILTNDDIIVLLDNNIKEAELLKIIGLKKADFDQSSVALFKIREKGASKKVINAILNKKNFNYVENGDVESSIIDKKNIKKKNQIVQNEKYRSGVRYFKYGRPNKARDVFTKLLEDGEIVRIQIKHLHLFTIGIYAQDDYCEGILVISKKSLDFTRTENTTKYNFFTEDEDFSVNWKDLKTIKHIRNDIGALKVSIKYIKDEESKKVTYRFYSFDSEIEKRDYSGVTLYKIDCNNCAIKTEPIYELIKIAKKLYS